jgi:hypothetical protein
MQCQNHFAEPNWHVLTFDFQGHILSTTGAALLELHLQCAICFVHESRVGMLCAVRHAPQNLVLQTLASFVGAQDLYMFVICQVWVMLYTCYYSLTCDFIFQKPVYPSLQCGH